jgi:hypothetical protein
MAISALMAPERAVMRQTRSNREDGLIGWRAVALLLLLTAILLALVAAHVSRAHF